MVKLKTTTDHALLEPLCHGYCVDHGCNALAPGDKQRDHEMIAYDAFADIMNGDVSILDGIKGGLMRLEHRDLKEAMKTLCVFVYGRDGMANEEAERCMPILSKAKPSTPIEQLSDVGAEDGLRVLEDIGIADDDGKDAWLDGEAFRAIVKSAIMSRFFMIGSPEDVLSKIKGKLPGGWKTHFEHMVVMQSTIQASGTKMHPFALIQKGSRISCSASGCASEDGLRIASASIKSSTGYDVEHGMLSYDVVDSIYIEHALGVADIPSSDAVPFAIRDEIAERSMKGFVSASHHLLHRVIDRNSWNDLPARPFESNYGAPIMMASKDLSMVLTDHRVQAMYVNAIKSGIEAGAAVFAQRDHTGSNDWSDAQPSVEGYLTPGASCRKSAFVVIYDKRSMEPLIAMRSYALACTERLYRDAVACVAAKGERQPFDDNVAATNLDDLVFIRLATRSGRDTWER